MITESKEYEEFLASIVKNSSYNPPNVITRIPTTEPIYQIDWDTRTIAGPEMIGVEADHEAEYVFFEMDRYYDQIDLAQCVGLVQFKNARREGWYQLIDKYDILSKPGKIIFAWDVQNPATKYSGSVSFSFKFFKINLASGELLYELNTTIATTKVLKGWGTVHPDDETKVITTADQVLVNGDQVAIALQNFQEAVQNGLCIKWFDL